jgi:hypothetical protein
LACSTVVAGLDRREVSNRRRAGDREQDTEQHADYGVGATSPHELPKAKRREQSQGRHPISEDLAELLREG